MPPSPEHAVLIAEDDPKISQLLVDYLKADGFAAHSVADGLSAVRMARQTTPDAVLLDVMLPGLDGIAVCRELRKFTDAPIIMLTARVDELDILLGLDTGADDYICKPFSPRQVVARVRAQLRRASGRVVAKTPPWRIDDETLRISWRGQWLGLTAVEFRMLRLLLNRPGRVFSRAQLLDTVHDDQRDVSDRAIDSHIKNLRRKLQAIEPGCDCLVSVYGAGYRFDAPE